MSVSFDDFTRMIEKRFPLSCAYEWDNSGAVIKLSDEVSGVFIALDLTSGVIDEAEKKGCDLILTHHPPVFKPLKKFAYDDPVTGAVLKAASKGISVYSAHTSCDCAFGGLNFELAHTLGLKDVRIFAKDGCENPDGGLGAAGVLNYDLNETEIAELVKERLQISAVRCSDTAGTFEEIAVIGGSGGDFYAEAARQGIKVLVTGEAKYNEFVEASACGVLLIEAGHYETERVFIPLAERILKEDAAAAGAELRVETAREGMASAFVH